MRNRERVLHRSTLPRLPLVVSGEVSPDALQICGATRTLFLGCLTDLHGLLLGCKHRRALRTAFFSRYFLRRSQTLTRRAKVFLDRLRVFLEGVSAISGREVVAALGRAATFTSGFFKDSKWTTQFANFNHSVNSELVIL